MLEIPAAVQKAVQEETKGATIKGYTKEVENGKTTYEVETTVNGHTRDLIFDPAGKLLIAEEEVSISAVPAPVKAAFEARGKVLLVETVTKGTVAPLSAAALAALPPRSEAPEIVAKILEEARASGVELPRGQYEYLPARDGVAARYRMTFPVHATYPQLREFMDRTLVALPAVAVEGMRIERKAVGEPGVDAELRLSAFVRSEE